MPTFRADFDVRSSLALPEGTGAAALASSVPGIVISLLNAPADQHGHTLYLIAKVVGPADSLNDAADTLREHLARELDALAFVTKTKFRIDQCTKVIEWEAFQKKRKMLVLQKFDPSSPPNPNLVPELLSSAAQFSKSLPQDTAVRHALNCFRMGLISAQPEEQFHYFWIAFETVAEDTKDTARSPIPCPKCRSNLWCSHCEEIPTRTPIAQQAMRELLASLRKDGSQVYDVLSGVRNHLAHGRPASTLAKKVGIELPVAVDLVAATAWHSLLRCAPQIQGLVVAEVETVLSRELIVGPDVEFLHDKSSEHPDDSAIPQLTISLQTQFAPPPQGIEQHRTGAAAIPDHGQIDRS